LKACKGTNADPNNNTATGTPRRVAFLDLLLGVQDEYGLTTEDIREEVDTFIFEGWLKGSFQLRRTFWSGHDTTGNTMGFGAHLLSISLDVQEKMFKELDEIFGGK
jgi:hypothetical protein